MQNQASQYAGQLHDAFYAYAKALNATLAQNSSTIGNGLALIANIEMKFEGTLRSLLRKLLCSFYKNFHQ